MHPAADIIGAKNVQSSLKDDKTPSKQNINRVNSVGRKLWISAICGCDFFKVIACQSAFPSKIKMLGIFHTRRDRGYDVLNKKCPYAPKRQTYGHRAIFGKWRFFMVSAPVDLQVVSPD